jgi:3-oxoacyl-[acyl-carrier-protein] synthase I
MSALPILAHSMVSALGLESGLACAAARAGISRARVLDGVTVSAAADGGPERVTAHPVPVITQGFEGEARLQRLVDQGLMGLLASCPALLELADHLGFYFSVPDPGRESQGQALPGDDDVQAEMADMAPKEAFDGALSQRLLSRAARSVNWPQAARLQRTSAAGHAGALALLDAARQDILSGRVKVAVLMAVDSLLSPGTLDWLHNTHRLKTTERPIGLMPGEGCALLVLAQPETLPQHQPQGWLLDVALGREPLSLLSGDTSVGEPMAQLMQRLCGPAAWDRPTGAWVLSDHNGEVHRANEWGHALVRLQGQWPAATDPVVWYPALNFGDSGAVSGLFAICWALQAFDRGYAPSDRAMVLSASEGEARAGAVIARAAPREEVSS